jgi:hypothetical protein
MKILAVVYFIVIQYLQETAQLYARIATLRGRIDELEKKRAVELALKKAVFTAQIISNKRGSYNGNPITTLSVVLMKCVGIKCEKTPVSLVLDAEDMRNLGGGQTMQEVISQKLKAMKLVSEDIAPVVIVEAPSQDPFAPDADPNIVPTFLGVPKK